MSSLWLAWKEEVIAQYDAQKQMAGAALAKVDDERFFARLTESDDDHTNSLAIVTITTTLN